MKAIIYSTSSCAWCSQVKKFLTYKGVEIIEKSADDPAVANEAFQVSGAMTVPVTVLNGRVIQGYNPSALVAALGS